MTSSPESKNEPHNGGRFLLVDPSPSPYPKPGGQHVESHQEESKYSSPNFPTKGNLGQHFWTALYLAATVGAFASKATKYANDANAMNLLGSSLVISRGAASCLNLNCALILLPISRSLVTRLMVSTRLPLTMPATTDTHKWLGFAILFWTVVHVGAHIVNGLQLSYADGDLIFALVGERLFGASIPDSPCQRCKSMLFQTRAGVTGLIMAMCMVVAYALLSFRRRHFESFWVSHHLLIVMLVALCFHGTGNIVEPFQSVYWLSFPLCLYLIPRARGGSSKCTRVLSAQIAEGGNILCLRLTKPPDWDPFVHKAGMYACLKVPALGRFQWHPFTMTSSPLDPFLEFHIKKVGNWTSRLMENVEKINRLPVAAHTKRRAREMTVRVDGPFAAAPVLPNHPIIALIGAGIGVTPAMGVLKSLLAEGSKTQPKRLYFYWTLRNQKVPEWFTQSLSKVLGSATSHRVLRMRYFLTQADRNRPESKEQLHQDVQQEVYCGRPHWGKELKRLQCEAENMGHSTCTILVCGPESMSKALKSEARAIEAEADGFQFYLVQESSF